MKLTQDNFTAIEEKLAIEGGKPVRTKPLPLEFPGVHHMDEEEIEAAWRVLKSRSPFRYYGIDLQGEVKAFESEFASFLGVTHAIAVNSGTGALHTALSALGVGPGQEVIVPAYMWVSVVAAVVNLGAIPVLADTDLIRASKRPMIVAGGGVHYSEAWDEIRQFAERVGIPVGETFSGRGAIREPSEWLVGGFGVTGAPSAGRIASEADLIICVGTRLTDFTTGSHSAFQNPDVRVISINVSSHDAFKIGALPIVADAREALRDLIEACQGVHSDPSWTASVREARADWDRRLREDVLVDFPGEAMSQGQLIRIINEEAQSGDTIVAAAGTPPGDLHKIWDATGGRTCHLEFGFSCMGYEIPAGIGVRLAQPEGEVFVLIGDGTYLMNPTEIVTAMQEGLKITVIISENHGYQAIRQLQMARAGRSFGNEFRARNASSGRLEGEYLTIDFAQNAESLGARVWKASTADHVRTALREARTEKRPCAVIVETEKHRYLPSSEVWWDVAPAAATHDPLTQDLRAQYEKERAKFQKFYG
jgi:3D-(3,5/4)-trihydroxycyclohexane-1,2-dione acylhydrolase (decyclizing)